MLLKQVCSVRTATGPSRVVQTPGVSRNLLLCGWAPGKGGLFLFLCPYHRYLILHIGGWSETLDSPGEASTSRLEEADPSAAVFSSHPSMLDSALVSRKWQQWQRFCRLELRDRIQLTTWTRPSRRTGIPASTSSFTPLLVQSGLSVCARWVDQWVLVGTAEHLGTNSSCASVFLPH